MGVSFLTPVAALFGLLAAVPLAVYAGRRRASRTRALGTAARAAAEATLGAARDLSRCGSRPRRRRGRPAGDHERADRSATKRRGGLHRARYLALDAGASSSGEPTRFERARDDALALQAELARHPVGIASLTDRVLPHLFPTVDRRVFGETMREAVGIERPPPSTSFGTNVTTLDALGAVPTLNSSPPRRNAGHSSSSRTASEPVTSVCRPTSHGSTSRSFASARGRSDLRVRSRRGGIHAKSGRGGVARDRGVAHARTRARGGAGR